MKNYWLNKKKEKKEKELARLTQFKRLTIPLIRRIYPQLIIKSN